MGRPSNKDKEVREKFDLASHFLNEIEKELLVDKGVRAPDLEKIALFHGKVMTVFISIIQDLEIYK